MKAEHNSRMELTLVPENNMDRAFLEAIAGMQAGPAKQSELPGTKTQAVIIKFSEPEDRHTRVDPLTALEGKP